MVVGVVDEEQVSRSKGTHGSRRRFDMCVGVLSFRRPLIDSHKSRKRRRFFDPIQDHRTERKNPNFSFFCFFAYSIQQRDYFGWIDIRLMIVCGVVGDITNG